MTINGNSMRFNEYNYGGPPSVTRNGPFSPRKRQRLVDHDLYAKWEDARKVMLKEDQQDNDGLPRFLSLFDPESKMSGPSDDELEAITHTAAEETLWVPPLPNPDFEIPGELVLAKEKKSSTQYWPAKIIEYVSPNQRNQKPRYKILFFDHTIKDVTEDMFYTEDQDGFATCKVCIRCTCWAINFLTATIMPVQLGESEGNYGMDEEECDIDEDFDPVVNEDEETLRTNSPDPELPPPKYFEALPIEKQFQYVKPILISILQNNYEPARPRHEAFMRSAASRQRVLDTEHDSGNIKSYELEALSPLIRQWVRRRQIRQEMGLIPVDDIPETAHQPIDEEEQEVRVANATGARAHQT